MGELTVRRNKGITVPRYLGTEKVEKHTGPEQPKQTSTRAAAIISEPLQQLMSRVSQAGRHFQEGTQLLQTGEAFLAEVEDNLEHMETLARKAAAEGDTASSSLQNSIEQRKEEIERIIHNGVEAELFQDGEVPEDLDALVDAVMDGLAAKEDGIEKLPAWLLRGMLGIAPSKAQLMAALGVDSGASGAQLLSALEQLSQTSSPTADYLAAFYLGMVISSGMSGAADPDLAAQGLWRLMEMVSQGVPSDQALQALTGGLFTSLEDFQAQFSAATAPGLESFLTSLLQSGNELLLLSDNLTLAAENTGELELLMGLLATLSGGEPEQTQLSDGMSTPESPQTEHMAFDALQVSGRDLSGVQLDSENHVLSVDTAQGLILRGSVQEQPMPVLRLTGNGTVTLQRVNTPQLQVESSQVRMIGIGENSLGKVYLGEKTEFTLRGNGWIHIGSVQGGASSVLRLTGGAIELEEPTHSSAVTVVVDGPVFLSAAEKAHVVNAQGEPLQPCDVLWKALLPKWNALTSLSVDGRQGQLNLRTDNLPDVLRLWLERKDSLHGYYAHSIVFQGRDQEGRIRTRYVYLRWEERAGSFQEVSMYPNPFTVTGGEEETDWQYEEESQTLRVLTGEVTAVAGGSGTNANQLPFSGRIVLADGIGPVELTLAGVECRVSSGGAFCLGKQNAVILLLQRDTDNVFESGPGYAGISMEEGTSLCIDGAKGARELREGTLTAVGGSGGAGIGRSSSTGQGKVEAIRIRGGVIRASGAGGGAGIGGALGVGVEDIHIQGGKITAHAECCAAAIGAGVQGPCGNIEITGSARILEAHGGGPYGDIGGCLFGGCGNVQVAFGTNPGGAKLWTQQGLRLQMGESTVTLPRFRISAQALHLDTLDLTTRKTAWEAVSVLAADRRRVARLQGAYDAMHSQLGQSFSTLYHSQQYTGVVRDAGQAGNLLLDMREMLRQSPLAAFLIQRGVQEVGPLLR